MNQRITPKMLKAQMLKELAKDFDWSAAGKRLGITKQKLHLLKKDQTFVKHGQKIIEKATEQIGGIDAAVEKFNNTQAILADALGAGEYSVASALVKTHELEYRMHGLFEKDNRQKGGTVMINIELETDPNPVMIEDNNAIDGEVVKDG